MSGSSADIDRVSREFENGMRDAFVQGMPVWLRALAWIAVAILPGGLFILPLLVADAVQRRRGRRLPSEGEAAAATAQ